MLFNSYEFIFAYLPVVFAGFFLIARHDHRLAALWLAAASLFFYGWWAPTFVLLLLASIVANFGFGHIIGQHASSRYGGPLLAVAITANLLLLGFFKYFNFFISTANSVGAQLPGLDIVLPLGISFFTFTQIAYLVDVRRGVAREYSFIHYLLFVTWFPHLIAGPLLHHKQMMPQFALPETYKPNAESIAVGLTIFSIGLFKKVVLADQFALFSDPVFAAAANDTRPALIEAWIAALAYTLQLYFDFSGYSDMAVGLSRIFNVKLPINFNSPYKAVNIIEFWRRWHITLSTFLRDYLYIPLGGNRHGPARRHANLMATMLLGGLWHGAGWNFVLWGGLHGAFLVINHGWRKLMGSDDAAHGRLVTAASVLLTFILVVIAWVPFRATSLEATLGIWSGMAGFNGISLPVSLTGMLERHLSGFVVFSGVPLGASVTVWHALFWLPAGLAIAWFLPNSQEWLSRYAPAWDVVRGHPRFSWQPSRAMAVAIGVVFAVSVLYFRKNSAFLYFQF